MPAALILLLLVLAGGATASAQVVTNSADSGPGTLRSAITNAASGAVITFDPSLSGATIALGSTLTINTNVTIDASALPGGLQINGNGSVQIFNVASNITVFLNTLTITNGNGLASGGLCGGILNYGTLTLTNCTLSGNSATNAFGGGIDNEGTLTLNNCTLLGNSVTGYGGFGGGIGNDGTLTLNQCTLSGNSAGSNGGGIENDGTLALNQCTLSGNSAAAGGGIDNDYGGTATLNQCTLSGNYAVFGGGIDNFSELTLNQCTLSGNSVPDFYGGGGIRNDNGGGTAKITITNTIVGGNGGADILNFSDAVINYGGSNLVQSIYYDSSYPSYITGPAPNLAPLGNYGGPTQTMPPLPGSPAIGAGSVADNTFSTDQRGYPRTQNGLIDLGAVESLLTLPPFTASPTSGTAPLSVQFNSTNVDSDGNAITQWNWNFGDGTTGTGQNPSHVYSTAGIFSPILIVANSLGLVQADSGPAITITVSFLVTNTADSGPGTLRSALTNAASRAVITFDPSLSGATITLSNTLTINTNHTNLTIDASALPGGLQINGNGAVQIFNVANFNITVLLNSLTITNGYSTNSGGGIYNGGTLTLTNCTLSGNTASVVGGYAGGIVNEGTLTLNNCTLLGNSETGYGVGRSVGDGGGIFNGGTLTMTNCTLTGNTQTGNSAFGGGGGIYNDGTVTLNQCTLSGNSATGGGGGGGIYNDGYGTLTLNQCTLSGNSAGDPYGGGGGIYNEDTVTLNQCTLSGNSAADSGGGIFNYRGTIALKNTIVAGNSGGLGADIYNYTGVTYGGANLVQTVDNSGTITGPAPLTNAPNLAPLGNYGGPTQTMPPLPGSPAIGAGSVAANTFSTDQRGYPRTQNGLIDLGAVELQSPAASPPVLKNLTAPAGGGNGLQFTFTNAPAADFTVLTATNVSLALTNWTVLGEVQQVAPGQYQFTDPQAATNPARFYRVRSP
jgi:hypothetical protein